MAFVLLWFSELVTFCCFLVVLRRVFSCLQLCLGVSWAVVMLMHK